MDGMVEDGESGTQPRLARRRGEHVARSLTRSRNRDSRRPAGGEIQVALPLSLSLYLSVKYQYPARSLPYSRSRA